MQEILNVKIEKLVFWGKWFARHSDGRVIFITWWAIPESIVHLKVLKKKKDFIEAQITEVVKRSPLETGNQQDTTGAPWINIAYEEQLKIKETQVQEACFHLKKYQEDISFLPIVPSPLINGYRNKIEFSFWKYISAKEWRNEQFNVWFHKRGEFSRVEDYETCPLIDDEMNSIYRQIRTFSKQSGYSAFDQKFHTGFYRHLVMRKWFHTWEIMLILSLFPGAFDESWAYEKAVEKIQAFLKELAKQHPSIVSLYISHNDNKADISIWRLELIHGKENIVEIILWLKFEISPKSFFQTNSLWAEKLYSVARDFLKNKENRTTLDLYAGTGTLGMIFAPFSQKVHSVELIKDASEDGEKNAKHNNITNIEFHAQKVEDFVKEFKNHHASTDLLIIDPPRAWMHPDALPNILEFAASQIIYISCNPATLSRDLEILVKDKNYTIEKIQAVDMFPHTHHIEVVVSLSKR